MQLTLQKTEFYINTAHSTPKPKLPVFPAHVTFFITSLLSVKFLTFTSPPVLDGRPRFLLVSSWGAASLSDMMPVTDTKARGYKPEQTSWSDSLHKCYMWTLQSTFPPSLLEKCVALEISNFQVLSYNNNFWLCLV
jgi:hypothetical protein